MEPVPLRWKHSLNHAKTSSTSTQHSWVAVRAKVLDSNGVRDVGEMGVSPEEDTGKPGGLIRRREEPGSVEQAVSPGSCVEPARPALHPPVIPGGPDTLSHTAASSDLLSDDCCYLDDYSQVRCYVLWEALLGAPAWVRWPCVRPLSCPSGQ